MAWLLDTNVLVNAKRDHYGFEFCPAFWSLRRVLPTRRPGTGWTSEGVM